MLNLDLSSTFELHMKDNCDEGYNDFDVDVKLSIFCSVDQLNGRSNFSVPKTKLAETTIDWVLTIWNVRWDRSTKILAGCEGSELLTSQFSPLNFGVHMTILVPSKQTILQSTY
eukprot:Gregarina_sp_Poly_1__71@NODE_1015_length_5360_cov_819_728887_g708_i0_p3_GENE_NODE_1015_length_5360_cov_819_728887_g708_i0NODE_1015_length_5360_cov_819_728887_g708_i0_p3_ORF_typecomplete_len114_score8_42_NODE_1015_length_5360_cov_819_728887_g708_i050015342